MSDNVRSIAPKPDVLEVAELLAQIASELREDTHKGGCRAVLVVVKDIAHCADASVYIAGNILSIDQAAGVLELGKTQMLSRDG